MANKLGYVLSTCLTLPRGHAIRNAAQWEFEKLWSDCGEDPKKVAKKIGLHVRSAQRLLVRYGIRSRSRKNVNDRYR